MSAIMLTSLGQAAGGPLGALTGSLLGSVADRALDRETGARDSRELRSSYGTIIPRLFGRNRTAGTIVWAQPMRRAGGGKGGGQRSYVMSLAIALSARRVLHIGRIWADGREIRSEDGRAEFPFLFRLLPAGSASGPDPLIAAVEGEDRAPGYRGLSIMVLEEFPLGPFGNRIPAFEFEVVADPEDSTAASWLFEAIEGATVDLAPEAERGLVGWPLAAPVFRQDLDQALRATGLVVGEQQGRLGPQQAGPLHLLRGSDVLMKDGEPALRHARRSGVRAMSAAVSYADVDRDYLEGEQQLFQSGQGEGLRVATPIAMPADAARAMALAMLSAEEATTANLTLRLSYRHLNIALGDRIALQGMDGQWLVVGRSLENFEIEISCEPWTDACSDLASDPGRVSKVPIARVVPGRLVVLELPDRLAELNHDGILVGVSAPDGWAGAELRVDDGAREWSLGVQRSPALAGTLMEPLGSGPETFWDETNSLSVRLDYEDAWLESRTADAVLAGANLIRCGDEMLHFRDAEAMGGGWFRLSGLLRGRMGSRPARPYWPAGADVFLLDPATFQSHRLVADVAGRELDVSALSMLGELATRHQFLGLGHSAMGPCHVRMVRQGDGSVRISWVGRHREWFNWAGMDAEIAPDTYLLQVWQNDVPVLARRVHGTSTVIYQTEQMAAFGAPWSDQRAQVVAEGVGPLAFRSSDWARLC